MRQLTKVSKPQVLETHAATWTAEYATAVASGTEKPARWRHPQIKAAIDVETLGLCAYCEAVVKDVGFIHVEHMLPRNCHPELVVEWTNLTNACPLCNHNKGSYCDHGVPLLNPYVDDPNDFLTFLSNLVWPKPGSDRARMTVETLDLNRLELANSRRRRLESVHSMIDGWARSQPPVRDALEAAILLDLERGEFSSCARSFAQSMSFPV